jgi:hypothetical protein
MWDSDTKASIALVRFQVLTVTSIKRQPSEIWRRVVSYKYTDVSDVRTAYIIIAISKPRVKKLGRDIRRGRTRQILIFMQGFVFALMMEAVRTSETSFNFYEINSVMWYKAVILFMNR